MYKIFYKSTRSYTDTKYETIRRGDKELERFIKVAKECGLVIIDIVKM